MEKATLGKDMYILLISGSLDLGVYLHRIEVV